MQINGLFFTRFETRTINNDSSSSAGRLPNAEFAQLSLNTDGGNLSLVDSGVGSSRLASMTQRVMERKTVTTSSETHNEKKSQQHSYRLN